jgi:hypothetical protein
MAPEAMRSDKSGTSLNEMAQQRSAYLDLVRGFPSHAVINGLQEPAAVIRDTLQAVVAHLERRTRKRLDLEA